MYSTVVNVGIYFVYCALYTTGVPTPLKMVKICKLEGMSIKRAIRNATFSKTENFFLSLNRNRARMSPLL
jgi:hypothetical protein